VADEPEEPAEPPERRPPGNRPGLVALVVGLLSLAFILLLYAPPLSFVLGVVAVVFGVRGRRRAAAGEATNRSQATAGLVTGAIAAALGGVLTVLGLLFYFSDEGRELRRCLDRADTEEQEEACRDAVD
jgi:hypothetical protein